MDVKFFGPLRSMATKYTTPLVLTQRKGGGVAVCILGDRSISVGRDPSRPGGAFRCSDALLGLGSGHPKVHEVAKKTPEELGIKLAQSFHTTPIAADPPVPIPPPPDGVGGLGCGGWRLGDGDGGGAGVTVAGNIAILCAISWPGMQFAAPHVATTEMM
jgi:hypothetical protein